jgi:hypothetical protein
LKNFVFLLFGLVGFAVGKLKIFIYYYNIYIYIEKTTLYSVGLIWVEEVKKCDFKVGQ